MRLIIDVERGQMADLFAALETVEHGGISIETNHDADAAEETKPARNGRKVPMAAADVTAAPATTAKRTAATAPANRGGGGGRKMLYTPKGTMKQIGAELAKLRKGSVAAFVLSDLAKHPKSLNAQVRERAMKAKINPESIDNAIWNLVNKGLVNKIEAAE